jgi:hypothetical protein
VRLKIAATAKADFGLDIFGLDIFIAPDFFRSQFAPGFLRKPLF